MAAGLSKGLTMLATDKCRNCGEEFGDHSYVHGAEVEWKCPHNHQDTGYGFFIGGDPRRFFPDPDGCSIAEIENHRIACEAWNQSELDGVVPEPVRPRATFGIGVYTCEWEQYWEPGGYDNADDEIEDLGINWDATAIDDGFEMLAEDDDGDDLEF